MRYAVVLCLAAMIMMMIACGAEDEGGGGGSTGGGGVSGSSGAGEGRDASTPMDGSGGGGRQGGTGTGGQQAGQGGAAGEAQAGAGSGGQAGDPDGGEPTPDAGGQSGSTSSCEPLPAPAGSTISVDASDTASLPGIVAGAAAGDTILLEDGVYALEGATVWIDTPGLTIRSRSGERDGVTLDGAYQSSEIITVAASEVTIADITIKQAYTHAIHVVSTDAGDTLDTLIYNVHIVDSREQAIKINPHEAKIYFPDHGTVACSHLELTDAGRPHVNPDPGGCYTGGVDAHQARGWTIRDNRIEGFWCPNALAEHGVHMWRGCRDTVVERNRFINNARAVGFGMADSGAARLYDDDPCPGVGYVGHYGGMVRNNFVFLNRPELVDTSGAADCGICFWSACQARALHNTIVSTNQAVSAIEWRFAASTGIEITNNLVTHQLWEREGGASAVQSGNLSIDSLQLFVDGPAGDLHLAPGATAAIDQGVAMADGACSDDIDGEPRDQAPDIGADELSGR